jgi:hypothetical protein
LIHVWDESRVCWNLQWDKSDYTSPAEANSTQVEESIVQLVSSTLDFGQDFDVILGKAWRDGFATLLGLLSECTGET